jgi:hypothetical protein
MRSAQTASRERENPRMIACAGLAASAVVRAGCARRKSGPPERSAHRRSCSGGAVPPIRQWARTVVDLRRIASLPASSPRLYSLPKTACSRKSTRSGMPPTVYRFRSGREIQSQLPVEFARADEFPKVAAVLGTGTGRGAKSLGVQATKNSENSCLPFEPVTGRAKRAWKLATEASRRQRSLCQEPAATRPRTRMAGRLFGFQRGEPSIGR